MSIASVIYMYLFTIILFPSSGKSPAVNKIKTTKSWDSPQAAGGSRKKTQTKNQKKEEEN